ncbi:MAG: hypothetical protein D6740_05975 [Alphaproteobacteria bacterium]|nr:MAG: hypothetical protein D6740_05975 [Alphaproteobacteria bacterium]
MVGALLVGAGFAGPVSAQQPPPEIVAGMKACLAVHKKRERLRCFETLAQETIARAEAAKGTGAKTPPAMAHGPTTSSPPVAAPARRTESRPAPSSPQTAPAAQEAGTRSDYGLKRKKARKEPRKLAVTITAAWPDRRGRWHFETADGQVWRQKDDVRVRLTKLPVAARLEKGMFGGYFLDIKGVPSDIRVERLR